MENNQPLSNQERKSIILNKELMEGDEKKLIELSDTINGFENETDFFALCADLKTIENRVLTNGISKIERHLASYQNYGNVIQSLSLMVLLVVSFLPIVFTDEANNIYFIPLTIISISVLVVAVSLAVLVTKNLKINKKMGKLTYLKLIVEDAIKEKRQV